MRNATISTILGIACLTMSGCGTGQGNAMLGAGVGGLAGQAIGGDTESTLIGVAVGYIFGNEVDKYEQNQRTVAEQKNGNTRRETRTRRVLNEDGTYTMTGTETTTSTQEEAGYEGLPE